MGTQERPVRRVPQAVRRLPRREGRELAMELGEEGFIAPFKAGLRGCAEVGEREAWELESLPQAGERRQPHTAREMGEVRLGEEG